jgi:hypothetical protein
MLGFGINSKGDKLKVTAKLRWSNYWFCLFKSFEKWKRIRIRGELSLISIVYLSNVFLALLTKSFK